MWIAIAIIVAVYFGLFAIESLWNVIVLTPPKIYAQQIDVIGELKAKNSILERELREPQVSQQEQRKRKTVREALGKFDDLEKTVFQAIQDNGEISVHALARMRKFGPNLYQVLDRGEQTNLLKKKSEDGRSVYSINPEFKTALAFVLNEKAG